MNENMEFCKQKYICINKKLFKYTIMLLIVFLCIYKCITWLNSELIPYNINRGYISNGKDSIFITYYVGGLLGDVQELILSNKRLENMHYNNDSVYILKDHMPIFYKSYNDTLFLYLNKEVIKPKYFISNIKIKILNVKQKEQFDRLNEIYNKSLKKIENKGESLYITN